MASDGGLMRDYLAYLHRRNLSPNSIVAYRRTILRWLAWCDSRAGQTTHHELNAWLDTLRLAPRSRYSYISAVHGFYRWAIREKQLSDDPTVRVDRPKLPRRLPRPISTDDLATAIDLAPDTRMRLWLCLASYGGLRCAEIAALEVDDLHLGRHPPLLIVHGKGDKERAVPLHAAVVAALRDHGVPRAGVLFPRLNHRRPVRAVQPGTVSETINHYLRDMGIWATAHQLRHWFGTETYAVSRDLRLVQELMGHASPQTTAVYVKFAQHEAAKVVDRLTLAPRSDLSFHAGTERGDGDVVATVASDADRSPPVTRRPNDGYSVGG